MLYKNLTSSRGKMYLEFLCIMEAVAQLVEHLVVVQDVAGSNPVGLPIYLQGLV